jgi:hypothetical protein
MIMNTKLLETFVVAAKFYIDDTVTHQKRVDWNIKGLVTEAHML